MPLSLTSIREALARLIRAARALAHPRRHAATAPATQSRATSLARTTEWLIALTRILAGDRHYHHPIAYPRFAGRYPSLTATLRAEIGLPPLPPPNEADRAAGRLHYMRRVFATVPTGTIATRLARRLGLTPRDPAWPHALAAIATPPARTALITAPGRRPRQFPWRVKPPSLLPLPVARSVPFETKPDRSAGAVFRAPERSGRLGREHRMRRNAVPDDRSGCVSEGTLRVRPVRPVPS